jgi:hypothetical protein
MRVPPAAQRLRAERPGQDRFTSSRRAGRVRSSEWLGGRRTASDELRRVDIVAFLHGRFMLGAEAGCVRPGSNDARKRDIGIGRGNHEFCVILLGLLKGVLDKERIAAGDDEHDR